MQDRAGGNNPFDAAATKYDAWSDTPLGSLLFQAEKQCLLPLVDVRLQPWLEAGVGTGRFGQALGVTYGLDASSNMLAIAAGRGLRVCQGLGERLPFGAKAFGGVLMVTTLCFVLDPNQVLQEIVRVLKPEGRLVLGMMPADGPWGQYYALRGRKGHAVWSHARFLTVSEVTNMAGALGWDFDKAYSTLLVGPEELQEVPTVCAGVLPGAGFVALSFVAGRPGSLASPPMSKTSGDDYGR